MALSTYTELGTLQHLNTQISFQQRQAELAGELLSYSNNFELQNTLLHPLYDQESFLHPEECSTHLLPYLSSCEPFISLSEMLAPPQDFEPYSFPKRQRCHENQFSLDFTPTFFDGLVPNPCMVAEVLPELFSQLPEYGIPQVDCTQNVESSKKMNERSVSAQSIAARERRRKITEKTQELGRLIPGCSKMNTAQMLQAASKYVKYLQAQVGILELMGSFQETYAVSPTEMQVILASPRVQEKLYLEDKCLVPKELSKLCVKEHDILSKPSISNDQNRLIKSEG